MQGTLQYLQRPAHPDIVVPSILISPLVNGQDVQCTINTEREYFSVQNLSLVNGTLFMHQDQANEVLTSLVNLQTHLPFVTHCTNTSSIRKCTKSVTMKSKKSQSHIQFKLGGVISQRLLKSVQFSLTDLLWSDSFTVVISKHGFHGHYI